MLNKINITGYTKLSIVTPMIKQFLVKNKKYRGLITEDYLNKIHLGNKKYIPQIFNNKIVFVSSKSFQQTNTKLSKLIHSYVLSLIKTEKLLAIGGESYLYGMTKKIETYHVTNSESIYQDCNFNSKYYCKITNNLVNYNEITELPDYDTCLINLSNLPTNLINVLNKTNINKIIIISCKHKDFWKKTKKINYKLIERKKFICNNLGYFVTVNVFIKNKYISLGSNCAVAWNIKKILKQETYPFDWCKMKYNQLVNVLSKKFNEYEKIQIKKLSDKHQHFETNKSSSYILKNKYNIQFAHEVLDKESVIKFEIRLLRRIERFNNLKNPIFIRLEQQKVKDYSKLCKILDKKFVNYKLIIISQHDIIKHKRIKHIKISDKFTDWKYEHLDWKKLILV